MLGHLSSRATLWLFIPAYPRHPIVVSEFASCVSRRMKPGLDRFAHTLSLRVLLRSPEGISALRELIALRKAARYVHNGVARKVILIEDKRVSEESSDAVWYDAMVQLAGCRPGACGKSSTGRGYVWHRHRGTLRAALHTLARCGHFVQLQFQCLDYSGEALHFKTDEESRHTLLMELVELIQQEEEGEEWFG